MTAKSAALEFRRLGILDLPSTDATNLVKHLWSKHVRCRQAQLRQAQTGTIEVLKKGDKHQCMIMRETRMELGMRSDTLYKPYVRHTCKADV